MIPDQNSAYREKLRNILSPFNSLWDGLLRSIEPVHAESNDSKSIADQYTQPHTLHGQGKRIPKAVEKYNARPVSYQTHPKGMGLNKYFVVVYRGHIKSEWTLATCRWDVSSCKTNLT